MRIAEHIEALRREGAELIAAVGRADMNAIVPTCPEWTVRELAHHMGRVHRWAAAYVTQARPDAMPDEERERVWGTMPADADLTGWLTEGLRRIVDALQEAPDALECYTFLAAPSARAFWARRQAHEVTIHRADAQAVTGAITGVGTDFAADGVDELLVGFYSRGRNRVRSDEPRRLAVRATDADAAWTVTVGPEGAASERGIHGDTADCVLSGPASVLYLFLWNRRDPEGLDITGDPALLGLWRDNATVRWR
jgi:uncharacterized protein (TIGR03083 family)